MTTIAARLGAWSAATIVVVGVAYAVTLAVGFARHGWDEPIADPVLAVMEVLTLLSAAPVVTLVAAIHARAAAERRVLAVAALAFATCFVAATFGVHFVGLTAERQTGGGGIAWPSRAYAVELLAWDVFLGLALLLAAPTFTGAGRERAARLGLAACGALCLAGAVGPLVGDMRLQRVGVFGYAVVLPVVALVLARLFAADARAR